MLDMPPGESYYRSRIPCPEDERVARVAGVTLFLQPTQDLTIDSDTGTKNAGRIRLATFAAPEATWPAIWKPAAAAALVIN